MSSEPTVERREWMRMWQDVGMLLDKGAASHGDGGEGEGRDAGLSPLTAWDLQKILLLSQLHWSDVLYLTNLGAILPQMTKIPKQHVDTS